MTPDYFVHPSSYIDQPCIIGRGTKIWHFCHIMAGCTIGENCSLGQNVVVSPGVVLGRGVRVQNNVSLYTGVVCEDDVFLGPSCVFTNVINPRSFIERKDEFRPTRICRGASIGANATILCGHTVGQYALVGAGAVVTRNLPAHALAVGAPARIVGWVCRCSGKLDDTGLCPACGNSYTMHDGAPVPQD